jgi:hypothetical protein
VFDQAVFWPQFKAIGMLETATLYPGTPDQRDIDVGFDQPGALQLDGAVGVTSFQIEYQTGDAPTLKREHRLLLKGTLYKCAQSPLPKGNGYFSTVMLSRVT